MRTPTLVTSIILAIGLALGFQACGERKLKDGVYVVTMTNDKPVTVTFPDWPKSLDQQIMERLVTAGWRSRELGWSLQKVTNEIELIFRPE